MLLERGLQIAAPTPLLPVVAGGTKPPRSEPESPPMATARAFPIRSGPYYGGIWVLPRVLSRSPVPRLLLSLELSAARGR